MGGCGEEGVNILSGEKVAYLISVNYAIFSTGETPCFPENSSALIQTEETTKEFMPKE